MSDSEIDCSEMLDVDGFSSNEEGVSEGGRTVSVPPRDDDKEEEAAAAEAAEPRKTGKPFERYRAYAIQNCLQAKGVAAERCPICQLLGGGKIIYQHWADVPASILAKIKWIARDPSERRRIYEGPPERRGFREYGGDWMVADDYENTTYVAIGQDKDRARLNLDILGRFIAAGSLAAKFNMEKGHDIKHTVNSFLCFPIESHLSQREEIVLDMWKNTLGMQTIVFKGFCPNKGEDGGDGGVARVDEDDPCDSAAARNDTIVVPSPPPRPDDKGRAAASSDAALSAVLTDKDVFEAAIPVGGNMRPFQTDAPKKIVAKNGIHLIVAPPGCGKTEVVVGALGRLITRERGTRSGKGKELIAFIIAPYIDHAKQFRDRSEKTLLKTHGTGWTNIVEVVADENVPTLTQLKTKLDGGVRIFISTESSAHLLLALAKHVKENKKQPILVIKDEAHASSIHTAPSTQLLRMVDAAAGDYGVACTATPDADVYALPGIMETLHMGLDRAIQLGYCAPYRISIPKVKTVAEDLPVEARDIANADRLGAAALFVVGGMLHDGKRRCIAYARNTKEAQKAKDFLERACAFHGAACTATVVVSKEHICKKADRKTIYEEFETGAVSEDVELDGKQGFRIHLRFLVSVRILDQCIDFKHCDSTAILTPPTSARGEARRTYQRMGRAARAKFGKIAVHYWFTAPDNPWLDEQFVYLKKMDPGSRKKLTIHDPNPVTEFTPESASEIVTEIEKVKERLKLESVKMYKLDTALGVQVLARFYADEPPQNKDGHRTQWIDESTGLLPEDEEPFCFLAYSFWSTHKTEFLPNRYPPIEEEEEEQQEIEQHDEEDDEGDEGEEGVVGGGRNCKPERTKMTGDQKAYLLDTLAWLAGWIETNDVVDAVQLEARLAMLVEHCKDRVPCAADLVVVDTSDDATYEFRPSITWQQIKANFNKGGVRKPSIDRPRLTDEWIKRLKAELPWVAEHEKKRLAMANQRRLHKDVKVELFIHYCANEQPYNNSDRNSRDPNRVYIPVYASSGLLPEGMEEFGFDAGTFWSSGISTHFVRGRTTHGSGTTSITPDQVERIRAACSWIEAWSEKQKEAEEQRGKKKEGKWQPTVAEKVTMLMHFCKEKKPLQGKQNEIVVDRASNFLPEGVEEYRFPAGQFWHNINTNFMVGRTSHHTKLSAEQVALIRAACPWVDWCEPEVDDKIGMLIALCKDAVPVQRNPDGSTKTISVPPDSGLLPPSWTKPYEFPAGKFWDSVQPNFVAGLKSRGAKLSTDQITRMRTQLPWVVKWQESYVSRGPSKRKAADGDDDTLELLTGAEEEAEAEPPPKKKKSAGGKRKAKAPPQYAIKRPATAGEAGSSAMGACVSSDDEA